MEEKKLTDEELLETMAFCIKKEECGKDCSLFNVQGCMWNMFNQSFQLIRRLQKKIKLLEINLANECEEHKQFVKLAKQIDEQQKAEIERLTLAVEGLKGENKVIHKENDELLGKIERLTKENSNVISMNDALYREKAELQKQVDELKEERYYTEQDTAKEILEAIFVCKKTSIIENEYDALIKWIKETFGVEVK